MVLLVISGARGRELRDHVALLHIQAFFEQKT